MTSKMRGVARNVAFMKEIRKERAIQMDNLKG